MALHLMICIASLVLKQFGLFIRPQSLVVQTICLMVGISTSIRTFFYPFSVYARKLLIERLELSQ